MQILGKLAVLTALILMSSGVHAARVKKAKPRSKTAMALTVPAASSQPSGLNFTFKTGAYRTHSDAGLVSMMGLSTEYGFYKTYAFILDVGFSKPLAEVRNDTWSGFGDPQISLTDKELWTNKVYGLTLRATVGGIIPSSKYSIKSSMQYGAFQALSLKQVVTDRFSVTYASSFTEYSWNYDTYYEDEEYDAYNTQYMNNSRISFAYDVRSDWHLNSTVGVLTYHTTGEENFSMLNLFLGTTIDANETASVDFGLRSVLRREQDPYPWSGPNTDKRFVDPRGFTYSVSISFKI